MSEIAQTDNLPAQKPSLLDYLESFLPFRLPRIPLPQTAKNLDKAAARLIEGKSLEHAHRLRMALAEEQARSRARVQLIKAGSETIVGRILEGDSDLQQRAIRAAMGEITAEQHNREKIVEIAARDLEDKPPLADAPVEIESDWLNMFSSFASQKSREDVQSLWGRLLAGEIRKPGSFSLGTLSQLSVLSAADASFVHGYMKFVFDGAHIYSGAKNEFVRVDDALHLEHLRVIHPASLNYLQYSIPPGKVGNVRLHGGQVVQIKSLKETKVVLDNLCFLTPFGKDLYTICNADNPPSEYAKAIAHHFKDADRQVALLTLAPPLPGENRQKILKREEL